MCAMASPGPMDDGGDSNPRSFGDSTEFEDEEDRQAAMADYELDNTQGDYINNSDALDDLFDEDDSCAFPPKLSEYQDADMTVEPVISMDKARFDVFIQYKNEYKLIRGMIAKLHRAFEGGDPR